MRVESREPRLNEKKQINTQSKKQRQCTKEKQKKIKQNKTRKCNVIQKPNEKHRENYTLNE